MLFLAASVLWGVHVVADGPLEEGFRDPPDSARPWVWYRWHGVVEREGIRMDLDAMKEAGIEGFVLDFSDRQAVTAKGISPTIGFASPEFFDLFYYLLAEAARRDLTVTPMFINGWATAGGHWVAPEDREHVLVWDEVPVAGPGLSTLKLTPPLTQEAFYRDIRVFAMPIEKIPTVTAFRQAEPRVSVDMHTPDMPDGFWNADPKFLIDGNPGSFLVLSWPSDKIPEVRLEFDQPFSADAVYLHPGATFNARVLDNAQCSLWVSDDGTSYRKVHTFDYSPVRAAGRSGVTFPLPERATGRFFRLQIGNVPWPHHVWLAELELLQGRPQADFLFWIGEDAYSPMANVTSIGSPPVGVSPSLADKVQGFDDKVTELSERIWGPIDGRAVKENTFGKGRVFWGLNIEEALREIGDLNLPEAERKTWLTINPHSAESPLRPTGLLGPVELLTKHSGDNQE